MTKIQIYSASGTKTGTYDLARDFSIQPNMNLLAQTMHVYEDRSHKGTSKVKTRSEVNKTRAKMYNQKGTGRARHGDAKAPIFVGGGIAHGPKGIKRILTLSNDLKKRALKMALDLKVKEGRIFMADKLELIKKTKDANKLLVNITKELDGKSNQVLLALASNKKEVARNFRNIKNVRILNWDNLNAYEVLLSGLVIIDKDAMNKTAAKAPSLKTELKDKPKVVKATKVPRKQSIKKVQLKVKTKSKK
jgi:large subunit ribosomal protein L4